MPPTLETDRLLLRTIAHADAPAVTELAGEWAIADTTATIPHPYDRAMAADFIARRSAPGADDAILLWAMVRRSDDRFLGVISLGLEPDIDAAELGYWLGVPFWGLGHTTEAGRAVLAHGFGVRGLTSVFADHLTRNPASHRVMEKLGMRQDGVLRRRFRKWGVLEDLCLHGILREEWRP